MSQREIATRIIRACELDKVLDEHMQLVLSDLIVGALERAFNGGVLSSSASNERTMTEWEQKLRRDCFEKAAQIAQRYRPGDVSDPGREIAREIRDLR